MIIGIPKEIKNFEYRVGATPALVHMFIEAGHEVWVQSGAGIGSGFDDKAYIAAGALIKPDAAQTYRADMVLKVKEPQPGECDLLHEGQILCSYLHLAPDPTLTQALLDKKVIGIAYETVTDAHGRLPLLYPMSEIAGRMAIQQGSVLLQMAYGGKGLLIGGVPGVLPARVTIIGGGAAGAESARMAMGLGAHVTIIDKDLNRLRMLDSLFGPHLNTLCSSVFAIEESIRQADLVIGAVLIPGKTAPKLITEKMIASMSPGSVFIDLSIDQGGCSCTSHPTTHSEPTYIVNGVVHYCVTNMPGAYSRTSTLALSNAIGEYVLAIANQGWMRAMDNPHLRDGLNVCLGHVTNLYVAGDQGRAYCEPEGLCE